MSFFFTKFKKILVLTKKSKHINTIKAIHNYMKSGKSIIGEYRIYRRKSPRGESIIIMPIEIGIDSFHGYNHLHFSLGGKKHEINPFLDFDTIFEIISLHINKHEKIKPNKLWRDFL